MKKYTCTFTGRARNAIGIFYQITDTVELACPSQFYDQLYQQLLIKLYDKYEHITFMKFSQVA